MGGDSRSRLRDDPAGHAVFEGTVSLVRNGGFASIRSTRADRGKPGAQTCFIEARATGKRFKLNLLTYDASHSINCRASSALARPEDPAEAVGDYPHHLPRWPDTLGNGTRPFAH